MKIARDKLNAYSANIDKLARAASSYAERSILASDLELSGVANLRDNAIELLEDTYSIFGDQASAYAASEYDAAMSQYGLELEAASTNQASYDSKKLRHDVGYKAQKIVNGDIEGFAKDMGAKASDYVRRSANQTMIDNAERDYKKGVRWARVPSGIKTCGFCVMLASRGFVYSSKEAAGYMAYSSFNRFHAFCDCTVMPGTEETKIEGYNPEHLRNVYLNARDTVEKYALRQWEKFTPEEKKELGGWSKWITNHVVDEINTRAPQWVYRGEKGIITKDKGAKPLPKEKTLANTLSENGFNVHFQETVIDKKSADLVINNQKWEIKQPRGNIEAQTIGKNTIWHQFEEAEKQCDRLILDLSLVGSYKSVGDSAYSEAVNLFYRRWSTKFNEVLIIDSNKGLLARYKSGQ